MRHNHLLVLIALTMTLIACQPAATSTPEARAPIATRAPVSAGDPIATAEPIDTAEPIATIETSADDWITFSSDEGGFSLLLPQQPQEQRQPVQTDVGTVEAIMYLVEAGNTAFGAGFSDFPASTAAADPDAVLAGARDGAANNVNGTVVDEQPIELNGFPGLEIAVEIPAASSVPGGALYRAQLFLVNNRLYQVIYVAPKADEDPADYQKLFTSFQLTAVPVPNSSSSPASSSALADWIEYRSAEGGFTVLLPGEPEVNTQLTDTDAGSVELTMALTEMDNYAAGVSFNDIPAAAQADPDALLQGGRDGAAANLNGTVISDKPIELNGYPGIEFVVETPGDLQYVARVFIVNDRLYQVLFLAAKDDIERFDVQAFFDSFTLLEQ
jgi:hypothetical protein